MKKEIAPVDRRSGPVQMESSPPIMQGLQHIATEPPAWAKTAGSVIHYLMNDFGGGRRRLKLAWVINFQKLATIPLLAIFLFKYQNFSPATWIYVAMQSSYGLVWIIKDLAFPDSRAFRSPPRSEQPLQVSSRSWAGTEYSAGCSSPAPLRPNTRFRTTPGSVYA